MLLLLVIIYLAFISLGLPDSILGSAWPAISNDLGVSLGFAGVVAIVISSGTVVSSLLSTRVIAAFGTGTTVAVSVLLTAAALMGFSYSTNVWVLVLLAVPLGLGGGAVDAALNNFVALHYKSKHMNYLHSFWGVGATLGPLIMATFLAQEAGWRGGYVAIGIIQFALVFVLFATKSLWSDDRMPLKRDSGHEEKFMSNTDALRVPGVSAQLILFFSYCALEAGAGLWAASFLVTQYEVSLPTAAFWTAMYYLGITGGRFLCGALSDSIDDSLMVRFGIGFIAVGIALMLLPLPVLSAKLGLILIGLGCAPIFPNTIHQTPLRFGRRASQAVVGLSMACAYIGTTTIPPIIGYLASVLSYAILPYILFLFLALIFITSEKLDRLIGFESIEASE